MKLCLVLAAILLAAPASAGSCRYYSYGSGSATSCTGGYHEYTSAGGYRQTWGIRNGGENRYPGERSYFRTR